MNISQFQIQLSKFTIMHLKMTEQLTLQLLLNLKSKTLMLLVVTKQATKNGNLCQLETMHLLTALICTQALKTALKLCKFQIQLKLLETVHLKTQLLMKTLQLV